MTALIIEDEIPAGKRLEKFLKEKDFSVLTILVSIKKAIHWFQENNPPDIVFMDIKLRDGNAFKILDTVEISSKIVFTTAYDTFALKAFDYNAIDYLLKPIEEKKLDKMILKLHAFKEEDYKLDLKNLKKSFQENFKNSFLIAVANTLKKIETHEITGFFSENNATFLNTNQDRIFSVNTSLEKLEQELNPNDFFRINRKYIINKKYINQVATKNQLSVVVKNLEKDDLKVSRLKMKLFLEWYGQ